MLDVTAEELRVAAPLASSIEQIAESQRLRLFVQGVSQVLHDQEFAGRRYDFADAPSAD